MATAAVNPFKDPPPAPPPPRTVNGVPQRNILDANPPAATPAAKRGRCSRCWSCMNPSRRWWCYGLIVPILGLYTFMLLSCVFNQFKDYYYISATTKSGTINVGLVELCTLDGKDGTPDCRNCIQWPADGLAKELWLDNLCFLPLVSMCSLAIMCFLYLYHTRRRFRHSDKYTVRLQRAIKTFGMISVASSVGFALHSYMLGKALEDLASDSTISFAKRGEPMAYISWVVAFLTWGFVYGISGIFRKRRGLSIWKPWQSLDGGVREGGLVMARPTA